MFKKEVRMSGVNLTSGRWRLHLVHDDINPAEMHHLESTVGPFGGNTDILLQFTPQPSELNSSAPESLKVTWYKGCVELDDPKHDQWDNPPKPGNFWAKVFPTTHDDAQRDFVELIQESFEVSADLPQGLNGVPPVRIFTGRYIPNERHFFGHGADNYGSSLVTFTLSYEEWPE